MKGYLFIKDTNMNKTKIDARLLAVADLVSDGAYLADVGTDHAYLPLYLAELGKLSGAVASDIHKGPLESAEKNIREAGFSDLICTVLTDGLQAKGLKVGTPFYLRYGRVAAEDHVSEIVGAKVVCVLIGERPGLATAESMSAYIVYNAYVGMPEAKRTVVSNIHKDGLPAVEAGAYIVEVIDQILQQKASGVDLKK